MLLTYTLAVVTALIPFLPSPNDKDGWGVRVHNLSRPGPYFVGENVDRVRFDVTLINFSKEARAYDPLPVIQEAGQLRLYLFQPDGQPFPNRYCEIGPLDPKRERPKLRSSEFASFALSFNHAGYYWFAQTGRYRLKSGWWSTKPSEGHARVEVARFRRAVAVATASARGPPNDDAGQRATAGIHPTGRVGNRTWLIYRTVLGSRWGGYNPSFGWRNAGSGRDEGVGDIWRLEADHDCIQGRGFQIGHDHSHHQSDWRGALDA